jgi:hypothetical protein
MKRYSNKKINSPEIECTRSSENMSISGMDEENDDFTDNNRLTQYEDYDQKVVRPVIQRNNSELSGVNGQRIRTS